MHGPRLSGPARHHRARRRDFGLGRVGVDRLAGEGSRRTRRVARAPLPSAIARATRFGTSGALRRRRSFCHDTRAHHRRMVDFDLRGGRCGRRHCRADHRPQRRLGRRGGRDLAADGRSRWWQPELPGGQAGAEWAQASAPQAPASRPPLPASPEHAPPSEVAAALSPCARHS